MRDCEGYCLGLAELEAAGQLRHGFAIRDDAHREPVAARVLNFGRARFSSAIDYQFLPDGLRNDDVAE